MTFFQKFSPGLVLRLGLGLTYLYSGFQLFNQPGLWRSFLPIWYANFIAGILSVETYLRLQGVTEVIMGLLFFAWFSGVWGVRIAAAYMALEMALILVFTGVDLITFRDIGLLAAALALLIITTSHSSSPKNSVGDGQPLQNNLI